MWFKCERKWYGENLRLIREGQGSLKYIQHILSRKCVLALKKKKKEAN